MEKFIEASFRETCSIRRKLTFKGFGIEHFKVKICYFENNLKQIKFILTVWLEGYR